MNRRIGLLCLATLLFGIVAWSPRESSLGIQVADRYHARNRTGNFYAKSAGKAQVRSAGSSAPGKQSQPQRAKIKASK